MTQATTAQQQKLYSVEYGIVEPESVEKILIHITNTKIVIEIAQNKGNNPERILYYQERLHTIIEQLKAKLTWFEYKTIDNDLLAARIELELKTCFVHTRIVELVEG